MSIHRGLVRLNVRVNLSCIPLVGGFSQLVAVGCHSLAAPAHLPVCAWADRPAATVSTTNSAALLERKELLRPEAFIMDLACSLDQVLQVCASEEIAQIHKFAMRLIFDIDDAPPVLTATDLLTANDDGLFASDDGKRNDALLG